MRSREDIQNTFSNVSDIVTWATVDHYLSAAFKVACRAARLLDIWAQNTSPRQKRMNFCYSEAFESSRIAKPSGIGHASHSPLASVDEQDLWVDYSPTETLKLQLKIIKFNERTQDTKPADLHERQSTTSEVPLWPSAHNSASLPQSSLSSPGIQLMPSATPNLTEEFTSKHASERLTAAHEQLLGDIGAFIGLTLPTRASLDLRASTNHSLKAAEDLLMVIDQISGIDPSRAHDITLASSDLRQKLATLSDTTNRLWSISVNQDGSDTLDTVGPERGRGLVAAVTACVRAAGDCTSKTRKFLARITDDRVTLNTQDRPRANCQPAGRITPRVEDLSGDWPEVIPGVAHPHDHESAESNPAGERLPGRPACLLRSTTDDTNNFTLSTVVPSGRMRRPDSLPSPLISCESPISPTSSEPPLGPPPPAHESQEDSQPDAKETWTPPNRKESLGVSTNESSSAYQDSLRNSIGSVASPTSTRATTPDKYQQHNRANHSLCTYGSVLSVATTAATDDGSDHEAAVLMQSYAHELLYNKDGQIVGGTLPALVEKLTSHHAPPDPEFNMVFLLTFHLFTNALELARTLINRYQYAGDCNVDSAPARLRVYNFFKTWLESHYLTDSDAPALCTIRSFATDHLSHQFPGPGQRLNELTNKASQKKITNATNQLVSAVGKTCVSLGTDYERTLIPHANINKEQLYLLMGGPSNKKCSLLDLDAVEIARQLTIMESKIFCAIQPQELLGLEWTRKSENAVNVLAMSRFSTSLTNLVADTLLAAEQVKKRVAVLKHWIKVARICLDINNYSALMAIVCSLTSSAICRLRQTWGELPTKLKAGFEEIKEIVDVSRNYATLRQRLQTPKAPCLPFVGMYLTDLTFIDAGNSDTRPLPSSDESDTEPKMVINFDKYMRSARIVSHIQRYQVPYRLQHVCEIQEWLGGQLERVHNSDECTVMSFWRRSQALESRSAEDDKHHDFNEEKEKVFSPGFIGIVLKPRNKASISGLNAFVHRSKNELLARVKTGGSGHSD